MSSIRKYPFWIWIILMVCFEGAALIYQPLNSFGSHQFTIWYDDMNAAKSYPTGFIYTVNTQRTYISVQHTGLVLCGYKNSFNTDLDFQAFMFNPQGLNVNSFPVNFYNTGTTYFFSASYFLIVTTYASISYIEVISGCTSYYIVVRWMTDISQYGINGAVYDQYFNQTSVGFGNFTIASDFSFDCYLAGVKSISNNFHGYFISVVSAVQSTNIVKMWAARWDLNTNVTSLTYTIVCYNKAALTANNIYYYQSGMVNITATNLNTYTTNYFTIPLEFHNITTQKTNCIIGIQQLWLNIVKIGPARQIFFNTSDPATDVMTDVVSSMESQDHHLYFSFCMMNVCDYIDSTTGTCKLCNQTLNNCTQCSSGSICTQCKAVDVFYIDTVNQTGCILCNSTLVNCLNCSDYMNCVVCSPGVSFFADNLTAPYGCKLCNSSLVNCVTCTSSTNCLTCNTNNIYYIERVASPLGCIPCNSTLLNCLSCSSSQTCTSCSGTNQYYLNISLNNRANCAPCSAITDCTLCTNSTTCVQCIDDTLLLIHSSCSKCFHYLTNCYRCNNTTNCIQCNSGYRLSATIGSRQCLCINGRQVINGCTNIQGCLQLVNSTSDICLLCDSANQFQLQNGTCVCQSGYTMANICLNISGCLTGKKLTNGAIICLFCDLQLHLTVSKGLCICNVGYFFNASGFCVQICGDGIQIYLACDDGNTVNNDGCSSTCQIQSGYICSKTSSINTTSICVYVKKMIFQLYFTEKIKDQNSGIFTFQITPASTAFNKLNISQYIFLDCGENTSTYSMQTSINQFSQQFLTIIQNYEKQDLETKNCTLQIFFPKQYFVYPVLSDYIIRYNFTALSNTSLLVVESTDVKYKILKKFSLSLGICGIILLMISAGAHKMIGVETIHVFQLLYLLRGINFNQDNFILEYYDVFKYPLVLYNQFYTYSSMVYGQLQLLNNPKIMVYKDFLKNIAILFIFLSLSIVGLIIIKLIFGYRFKTLTYDKHRIKEMSEIQVKQNTVLILQKKQFSERISRYYKIIVFPLFEGFFMAILLSIFCHSSAITSTSPKSSYFDNISTNILQSEPQLKSLIPLKAAELTVLFSMVAYCWIFHLETTKLFGIKYYYKKFREVRQLHGLYIPLYLIYMLILFSTIILGKLISTTNTNAYGFAIISIEALYLLAILIYRPYQVHVHNVSIIINQLAIMLFSGGMIYYNQFSNNQTPSLDFEVNFHFTQIILLLLVIAFALVRLTFEYVRMCKQYLISLSKEVATQLMEVKQNERTVQTYEYINEPVREEINYINPYRVEKLALEQNYQQYQEINFKRNSNKLNEIQFELNQDKYRNIIAKDKKIKFQIEEKKLLKNKATEQISEKDILKQMKFRLKESLIHSKNNKVDENIY